MITGSITIKFETGKDPDISFSGVVDVMQISLLNYHLRSAYQLKYVDPNRAKELAEENKNKAIAEKQAAELRAKKVLDTKKSIENKQKEMELAKKQFAEKQAKEKAENEIVEAQRILSKVNLEANNQERIKWAKDILAKKTEADKALQTATTSPDKKA